MNNQKKKIEYTYSSIKLALYVKILLCGHFLLFFSLFIDLILPILFKLLTILISPILFNLNSEFAKQLPGFFFCVFKYKLDTDIKIALLSALLVIWTFITAIVIFYMEKKDNLYCGVRTWDIVSFDLSKNIKKISACIFFAELLLILLSFIFDFFWTLIILLVLYPATAGCTFGFVCWATRTDTIRNRYYDKILHEYCERSSNYSAASMDRVPSLTVYLNSISSFTEKDWDILIELLLNTFIFLCLKSSKDKQTDVQRTLYTIIKYILDNTDNVNQKIKFLKNLSLETYKKAKDSSALLDIMTAISLPAIAFHDRSGYYYYTSCFAVIPDKDLLHQMLLRGIVYSVFLLETTGISPYSSYCRELQSRLDPTRPSRREDRRQMLLFANKLNKYDSRFAPITLGKYI